MWGESHVAFQAFRTYAELGPGPRLVDVARQLSKSIVLMNRWSQRWHWQARCAAYDTDQWLREDEDKRKQRDEGPEGRVRLGMAMRGVAARALVGDPSIDLAPFDPRKLSGAEISRLAEVTDKLIALGLGLPTDYSQLAVAMQAQVQHQLPVGMEEIDRSPLGIDSAYVAASLLPRESRETPEACRSMAADLRRLAKPRR